MMKGASLSENLRINRARLNISREKLSNLSGVSVSTIEKIENGRQAELSTTFRTIDNLAHALKIKPQKLIGWE